MIMLIRAPLESASRPIAENSFSGIPSGPCLTTSSSGPLEAGEVAGRDHDRGADGDQEVEDAGDPEPDEQDLGVGAARVLGLLGDVDRVLEADQRVEGERGAGEHRGEDADALLELERATGSASPWAIATTAISTISSSPPISTMVKPTLSFTDSAIPRRLTSVIAASSSERAEHDLEVDELAQVVAAEAARERARRGDPRGDHGEGDDEAERSGS